jgi:hypothetical protein
MSFLEGCRWLENSEETGRNLVLVVGNPRARAVLLDVAGEHVSYTPH